MSEQEIITNGCQIVYSRESIEEMLGINGELREIRFEPNLDICVAFFTGDDEHFPKVNQTNGTVDVCESQYLHIVNPNKIVKLTDSNGKQYVHRQRLPKVKRGDC